MKNVVHVEFIAGVLDAPLLAEKLKLLGDEFEMVTSELEFEQVTSSTYREYLSVSGKITSDTASFIKLSDPFLAERMRISYISDELKNKYRR